MAVGTERNQVLIVVALAGLPRHDVMEVDLRVPTSVNRAAMARFDQHPSSEFGGDSGPVAHLRVVGYRWWLTGSKRRSRPCADSNAPEARVVTRSLLDVARDECATRNNDSAIRT